MKIILVVLLVLMVGLGVFMVKYAVLKLNVSFANGQVAIFEDMKVSANGITDPKQLADKLEYVVNYYPSGTKQAKGTQLDKIVETARSNSVAVIIARLRDVTGKDFGNSPQQWLKEYPPSR